MVVQVSSKRFLENDNLKADVHVLSYCWCGDFIRSAFSSGDLGVLRIYSNELAYEESISTGEIIKKMEYAVEKLHVSRDILKEGCSNDTEHLTVYIGGSMGGLFCLLEADIGIIVSPCLSEHGAEVIYFDEGVIPKKENIMYRRTFHGEISIQLIFLDKSLEIGNIS